MNVIFQGIVSETSLRFVTPFVLFVIGIIVEKKYVSRVSMFANATALFIFYHSITMSTGLGLIVNTAIIMGLIGGVSRAFKISLTGQFYNIAWVVSSGTTGFLLLYGLSL